MPPRRERQQRQQQEGPVWQPVHRLAFVQHLMTVGCMKEQRAMDVFEQLTGSTNVEEYQELIAKQNEEMQHLSLQIRTLKHPADKQVYVGLVNTMADTPSKSATHYKHGQREFFKHVLAAIAADPAAEDGVGASSGIQLLNLDLSHPLPNQEVSDAQRAASAEAKKLTKTEKESVLKQLVEEKWLQYSRTCPGHYCIGPRTFLELSDLLLSFDLPDATRDAWALFL